MSNISLCSLRVADEVFGFETHEVYEVLGVRDVEAVLLAPDFVAGMISYRGEILMVLSFRKLLGMEQGNKSSNIVVLQDEYEGEPFGLAVDAMGDVLSVDDDDFEENSPSLDARRKVFFAGSYKWGDGLVTHLKPELLLPMRLLESFGSEARRTYAQFDCG